MKLDRNINADGHGKYAVVRVRGPLSDSARYAIGLLQEDGIIDFGTLGEPDEFFVIKLRDKYAGIALAAYALVAAADDPEYATEVRDLALRAGPNSPFCKKPD